MNGIVTSFLAECRAELQDRESISSTPSGRFVCTSSTIRMNGIVTCWFKPVAKRTQYTSHSCCHTMKTPTSSSDQARQRKAGKCEQLEWSLAGFHVKLAPPK